MSRAASSDPFFDKGLPANVEAERSILGAIILDNAVCNQAIELLRREDFFLDSHRRIYEKMVALSERGSIIDLVTLSEELRKVRRVAEKLTNWSRGLQRVADRMWVADLPMLPMPPYSQGEGWAIDTWWAKPGAPM